MQPLPEFWFTFGATVFLFLLILLLCFASSLDSVFLCRCVCVPTLVFILIHLLHADAVDEHTTEIYTRNITSKKNSHTHVHIYIQNCTQQIRNDAIVFHLHFIWYNFAWSRSFARYFLQSRAFATACINRTVWFYSVVQICDQTVRLEPQKKGSVFWIKMLWIQVTAIQDTNSTENEDITYKLVSQSSCCWLVVEFLLFGRSFVYVLTATSYCMLLQCFPLRCARCFCAKVFICDVFCPFFRNVDGYRWIWMCLSNKTSIKTTVCYVQMAKSQWTE